MIRRILGGNRGGAAIPDGLIAYYNGQISGSSIIDSLGNVNGVNYGLVNATGKIGNGLNQTTPKDYYFDANISGLKSMCFWINPSFTGAWSYIVDLRLAVSAYFAYGGTAGFSKMALNGVLQGSISTNNLASGQFNHVYLELTSTSTGVVRFMNRYNTQIGQGLNGTMDEIACFNKVLSQAEILENYNNGNGITL